MPRLIDALLLSALSMGILLPALWPTHRSEARDTFSAGPAGKEAIFRVMQELYPASRRVTSGLHVPRDVSTLIVLGPVRAPLTRELDRLHEWTSRGNTLIWASRVDQPEVDLGPFELRIEAWDDAGDEVTGPLHSGSIPWKSSGAIDEELTDRVLLRTGDSVQAIERSIGLGRLVAIASDDIFVNTAVGRADRGVLAVRLLERGEPYLAFEETLSGSGAPKILGLVFDAPFRSLTCQILLLVLLHAWIGLRRSAPVESSTRQVHRSYAEHAEALGNLHFRSGDGRGVLIAYWDHLRRRLGLERHRRPALALARGDESVAEQIETIARTAGGQMLIPPQRAATSLRFLAATVREQESSGARSDHQKPLA